MNRRYIGALAMLLLASATGADAADFYRQAESCWFTRMPAAQRPACCDFSAKDRFTRVGGDCCKVMNWTAQAPALDAFVPSGIPQPMLAAPVWIAAVSGFVPVMAEGPPPEARGPPHRFHPTRDTVFLI